MAMLSGVLPMGEVQNVTQFIYPYFNQAVYPTVSVSMGDDGVATLTPMLYFNQSQLPPSDFGYQWTIPIFYQSASQPQTQMKFLSASIFIWSPQWEQQIIL